MAQFNETFLCTALPEGINGTKLRVAVLVSPRLQSDSAAPATLQNWPDAVDWPAVRPTWKVRIAQGATEVTLDGSEIGAGSYDLASWQELFPAGSSVTPYQPEDRSTAPIASYPVAKVRDAIRNIHLEVLANSRTDFPTVDALQQSPTFRALKEAVNPGQDGEASTGLIFGPDPVPDADVTLGDAFTMVEQFHGVRPGSLPPPTITSVSPPKGPAPGGTLATLTGVSLFGATAVGFGGVPATEVVVTSATSLTCRSPRGTEDTTVEVTVTTQSGTSSPSAAARFTYDTPPPSISVIDPRSIVGGQGEVKIKGADLEYVTAVQFGDKVATPTTVSATELTCTAPFVAQPQGPPPTVNITVDVTVTNSGGRSNKLPFTYYFVAVPR